MNQTLTDLAHEARDAALLDDLDDDLEYELRMEFHQDDGRRCPECGYTGSHAQGCPEAVDAPMYEEDHPDYEVES